MTAVGGRRAYGASTVLLDAHKLEALLSTPSVS